MGLDIYFQEKDSQIQKELELLAKLKEKYEN